MSGTLTQSLFNLSLIQRWRASRAGVQVAELDAEANRRDTMATVGLLYTEALRAEAAVKASEANNQLNEQLLKLAFPRSVSAEITALSVFAPISYSAPIPAPSSLSVPIFDGGQREGRISESRSQLRQEDIRMQDVSAQVTLEVRDALLTIDSTKQQVAVSHEGLRLALRELELSRERFAVGVANNIEVTNAQTSVARARDNVIEALSNYNAARINLARAKGEMGKL